MEKPVAKLHRTMLLTVLETALCMNVDEEILKLEMSDTEIVAFPNVHKRLMELKNLKR